MHIRLPAGLLELRERGRRRLFFIPYIFTFANAILGLFAVMYAWDEQYRAAAYCIMLAAFSDSLDGRLARALGSCNTLGMELDSLCDAVSFCLAPAIILYGAFFASTPLIGKIVVCCYLCLGLFRLARFNNICTRQKTFFTGLPTPVAAVFFALVVLSVVPPFSAAPCQAHESWIIMALSIIFAVLMASSIKFPSFKDDVRHDARTKTVIGFSVLAAVAALVYRLPVLLSVVCTYVMVSIMYGVRERWYAQNR